MIVICISLYITWTPQADFRVRPAEEKPSAPAAYRTTFGIVRLSEESGYEKQWIQMLRDAMKR
jgi:hypothetical protein